MRNLSLVLLLFLGSCNCNYHIKRVHKKCGVQSDTIFIQDTTIIPRVKTDSVFFYNQSDTVVIREGRLTMKYFYNTNDSTVYIHGQCDTVKIIKKIPVTVNNYKKSENYWYLWVIGFLLAIILMKRFRVL